LSKIVIFGNSGSGKSTLAKQLSLSDDLAHLDLDTIAWKPCLPPERLPISESSITISEFFKTHDSWVIEGCYSDLLALVIYKADEVIFLNLPISSCIENAKNRPWEPHKYESREAQDENLAMLIEWISEYNLRDDTFSQLAHENIFTKFTGKKTMRTSNLHHKL